MKVNFRCGLYLPFLALLLLNCVSKDRQASTEKQGKPNIIFIFSDDQRFETIRALGNTEIITPNLDRLVNSGTTFTHAYNMGAWNGAVCVASRAMLISGRSVWRALAMDSVFRNGGGIDQTWGKLMEQGGYDTYMTGKWHVQAPAEKVFKTTTHIRPGMPGDAWNHRGGLSTRKPTDKDTMPIGYNRPLSENDHSWSPTDTAFGGFWEGGKHWSEVLKDDAITFIDTASRNEKPFFMYLAFNAPHDPRQAPQEYQDMYQLENISLPPNWLKMYPYQNEIGNGPSLRDAALAPFPRTNYATKVHIKEYYASISHLDAQIGMILDALEKSGKAENTYIIFTADHGLAVGNHGLMGKQNMYDHSIRPPFIVVGPGIPVNQKIDTDIYLQDAMATALALGEIEKPPYIEFNSVLDLAAGKSTTSAYQSIYGCYTDLQRMIRKDQWKLIVYPKAEKVRLYNLAVDAFEMNDLANDPKQREKVKLLFDDLLKLQQEMEDGLDLTDVYTKTVK